MGWEVSLCSWSLVWLDSSVSVHTITTYFLVWSNLVKMETSCRFLPPTASVHWPFTALCTPLFGFPYAQVVWPDWATFIDIWRLFTGHTVPKPCSWPLVAFTLMRLAQYASNIHLMQSIYWVDLKATDYCIKRTNVNIAGHTVDHKFGRTVKKSDLAVSNSLHSRAFEGFVINNIVNEV